MFIESLKDVLQIYVFKKSKKRLNKNFYEHFYDTYSLYYYICGYFKTRINNNGRTNCSGRERQS